MLQRERGKDKALRIDLMYFRRRTLLGVCRVIAAATGLILAVSYGAWVLSLERRAAAPNNSNRAAHLSTGPLALVHAHFENDCQACHSDQLGVALAHDAWQPAPAERLELQEVKCKECHDVQGHAQAMLARPEMDRDCAGCHRDHRGRQNVLTAVSQKTCTQCHADLNNACKAGIQPQLLPSISEFSIRSHGMAVSSSTTSVENFEKDISTLGTQFRSLRKDSGRVRFDHAQHLRPGQVDPNSRGGFQLSMLAPALRSVYRKPDQVDSSLVQLDCNSCHDPDAIRESTYNSAIAREEGRFYAPIDFEKHCAACHQISFAGQEPEHLSLPHVAQRGEFARLLSAKQIDGTLRGKVTMPGDQAVDLADAEKGAAASKPIELKEEQVEAAVTAVFSRCQQCHLEEDTTPEVIASALAGTLEPLIPQRWLQRGYFDHASHAGIERCAYCHEMPTAVGDSHDQAIVLIKGPESCVPCHRPGDAPTPPEFATQAKRLEQLGRKNQPTWASDDCSTCHRYHWSRPKSLPNQADAVLR